MKEPKLKVCVVIIILLYIWMACVFSSCSPRYTEAQAKKLYGCHDTISVKTDSAAPALAKIDSGSTITILPGDTVYIKTPCEEIANMKPGQSKKQKQGNSFQEYGKDSSGNSFFKSTCDSVVHQRDWYKEKWLQTVTKTISVTSATPEPTTWQNIKEQAINFFAIWGVIALIGFVIFMIPQRRS